MSSRSGPQTVKKAVENLPGGVAAIIRDPTPWSTATLLDVNLGGNYVVRDALDSLSDADFIHVSVAAIYCRCSETTFNNHRPPGLSLGDLKERGDTKMLPCRSGTQTRRERYYRVGFVKEIRETIRSASDIGDDARAKKLIQQHTPEGRLSIQLRKKIAWIADENGHIYAPITIECKDGSAHLAKLFQKGARIQILTFQQAMTERTWLDPAKRALFHDYYLELLDAERQLLVIKGEESAAMSLALSLEQIVPKTSRPGTRTGMRRL
ncbi:hypothetical protein [Dokdonella immobilis]|uniref:Uncharacterized protein n=1 Tax=Dokdonella immobilis TaxID=578942 RepID=A0A1I4XYK1_9GAMM|nr:hypothetical protein [Dokdonella immobilis]SFN31001.1 hypothetical protein SAMN05216289_11354 [Dokdonella immobilis]